MRLGIEILAVEYDVKGAIDEIERVIDQNSWRNSYIEPIEDRYNRVLETAPRFAAIKALLNEMREHFTGAELDELIGTLG